jgi:hypothetical protein
LPHTTDTVSIHCLKPFLSPSTSPPITHHSPCGRPNMLPTTQGLPTLQQRRCCRRLPLHPGPVLLISQPV